MFVAADVMACIYLDNKLVKQTDWKPVSQQCWDLRFTLDLDRVRCCACCMFIKSLLSYFLEHKLFPCVIGLLILRTCVSCTSHVMHMGLVSIPTELGGHSLHSAVCSILFTLGLLSLVLLKILKVGLIQFTYFKLEYLISEICRNKHHFACVFILWPLRITSVTYTQWTIHVQCYDYSCKLLSPTLCVDACRCLTL